MRIPQILQKLIRRKHPETPPLRRIAEEYRKGAPVPDCPSGIGPVMRSQLNRGDAHNEYRRQDPVSEQERIVREVAEAHGYAVTRYPMEGWH